MAPNLKPYTICVTWPLPSRLREKYTNDNGSAKDNIKVWLTRNGATYQTKLSEDTTHLVVDQAAWTAQGDTVKEALASSSIKIVSPDWVEAVVDGAKKVREGSYLWQKLDPHPGQEAPTSKAKEPKAHTALMAEVFRDATDGYIDERDKARFEAENAAAEQVRRDLEAAREAEVREAKRVEMEKKKAERAEKRRGGGRDVFGDGWKVYKDTTPFEYDVSLVKVDTKKNMNERQVLTFKIFQAIPPEPKPPGYQDTYATNLHFAGTGKRPRNNVLAAIGSNFPTAFRVFRIAFREATGIDWDDRIKAHNARVQARQEERARGERFGRSEVRREEEEVPFEQRKFTYTPPVYGGRGYLPKSNQPSAGGLVSARSSVLDFEPEAIDGGDDEMDITSIAGDGALPTTENDRDLTPRVSLLQRSQDEETGFQDFIQGVQATVAQSDIDMKSEAATSRAGIMGPPAQYNQDFGMGSVNGDEYKEEDQPAPMPGLNTDFENQLNEHPNNNGSDEFALPNGDVDFDAMCANLGGNANSSTQPGGAGNDDFDATFQGMLDNNNDAATGPANFENFDFGTFMGNGNSGAEQNNMNFDFDPPNFSLADSNQAIGLHTQLAPLSSAAPALPTQAGVETQLATNMGQALMAMPMSDTEALMTTAVSGVEEVPETEMADGETEQGLGKRKRAGDDMVEGEGGERSAKRVGEAVEVVG